MLLPVNDPRKEELLPYAIANESKIKGEGYFVAESPNVILRALKAGYILKSMLIEERYLHFEDKTNEDNNNLWASVKEVLKVAKQVPIYLAPLETISTICGFRQSHGFLALFSRKKKMSVEEVIQGAKRIAILEDIENPTNVGSIFRSAAALGMDGILLTPSSSDPLYRRAVRVSMGGVFQLPWAFIEEDWPGDGITSLKKEGFHLAAMALSAKAIPISDSKLNQKEKLAILFGNEQHGLSQNSLEEADDIIEIPMYHEMDSLNVASSSAIAFYQLVKKAHD